MLNICVSPCHRRKRSARADAVTYVSLMTRVTYVSPMPQAQAERKSERTVSEPLTLQIVSELLRSDAVSQSGWVLDGYPRSIDQLALKRYGFSEGKINDLFNAADANHDNVLSVQEFAKGMVPILMQVEGIQAQSDICQYMCMYVYMYI